MIFSIYVMVPNAHDGHNVVECTNHHIEEEQQEEPVVLKAYAVVYPWTMVIHVKYA